MQASLILPTYNRDTLLKICLKRIREYSNCEIIIVNDGGTCDTEIIAKEYQCKYIYTGNKSWRVPATALNIGVKAATNPIVILSCPEMYHIDDLLNQYMPQGLEMVIPKGKDDNGDYLKNIIDTGNHDDKIYNSLPNLNTKLPFYLAIRRELYIDIGGYDEDFIGQGYDDDDFVTRVLDFGGKYINISGRIVHLHHRRIAPTRHKYNLEYNRNLFKMRRGIIKRNNGKDWSNVEELHISR